MGENAVDIRTLVCFSVCYRVRVWLSHFRVCFPENSVEQNRFICTFLCFQNWAPISVVQVIGIVKRRNENKTHQETEKRHLLVQHFKRSERRKFGLVKYLISLVNDEVWKANSRLLSFKYTI
jgi:hypothetical protein